MAEAPTAPAAPGGDEEEMDWSPVFLQAPVHVLGHFLDRKDFAALQTTSARMQESVRTCSVLATRSCRRGSGWGTSGGRSACGGW